MKDEELAMTFWNRVDGLWQGRSLKDLAHTVSVDYVLLLNWRTKKRLPSLKDACVLAKNLNTSVEYLVTGSEVDEKSSRSLFHAYQTASESNKKIVDIALGLSQDNSQTEMMSV